MKAIKLSSKKKLSKKQERFLIKKLSNLTNVLADSLKSVKRAKKFLNKIA